MRVTLTSNDGRLAPADGPVFGVGLGKTGTKTLRHCLVEWGFEVGAVWEEAFGHYLTDDTDAIVAIATRHDAFEDWPWPLVFREMDEAFPNARFVLTVRRDADTWYRSLCKMAVRIGPLREYDERVYGWAMPQGHRDAFVEFYEQHNRAVRDHFAGRPDKLIEICWEAETTTDRLARFLDRAPLDSIPHANRSDRVYDGDRRWLAEINRIAYQGYRRLRRTVGRLVRRSRRTR